MREICSNHLAAYTIFLWSSTQYCKLLSNESLMNLCTFLFFTTGITNPKKQCICTTKISHIYTHKPGRKFFKK
jgi:hypothetical protein